MYWSWLRLGAAAIGLSGIAAGYIVNVDRATRQGQDLAIVLANYFSLFTIVSTTLSIGALTAAAAWSRLHPGTTREPLGIALPMALVTGPVLLLGLVYNALLRDVPSEVALGDSAGIATLDAYAIEVLHVVLPLYFLADLFFATRRRGLPWWTLPVLAGYPLLWLVYTMVRGELVADPSGATVWWYPYPFLDPHGAGGWTSAGMYIGAIFAAFVGIGAGIIAIGRFRERRAARHEAIAPLVPVHHV
ncbi:Pr6Pr family membrane protein [Microbacterium sp. CFBP9034]|uniref:Pr6Pr family membrane protein n=1 Tax=Microbacterium sp. CFBP9034 TaxID=3096540 RepID=UPI002A6B6137|nr:Pr6Pr family membrane protein [Microbacterium sp. CFBP9034]MDY0908089.1 Pr6Pr family membrane protein [Microbacterium sp. CFBP9034]